MIIDPTVNEWLNVIARWTHVFAGIMWVGSTYYFTWLDGRLTEEERGTAAGGEPAQVWMVHSGGFYVVEKRKKPSERPLHWFRWEAATTWLSGFALLTLMAYLGGGTGLVDRDVLDISGPVAIMIGIGTLIVGWVVYDLLVQSPLGKNELLFAVIAYALVVGAAYGLTHTLSGRWAYLHLGAMFGTIMVANVWMRILPAQRRMIAATKKMSVIKHCPKCNRTYSDESLSFCLADGTLLTASHDSQATAQIAAPRSTDEMPTEILPLDAIPISQTTSSSLPATAEEVFSSTLAARAKLRSKHNTFMAVPVVFMMISNHYPVTTYGHDSNWIILSVLILLGWGAAKFIRRA